MMHPILWPNLFFQQKKKEPFWSCYRSEFQDMMNMSQTCAHSCARKPRPLPQTAHFFCTRILNGAGKSAHRARGSKQTLRAISNLTCCDKLLDAFWVLVHNSRLTTVTCQYSAFSKNFNFKIFTIFFFNFSQGHVSARRNVCAVVKVHQWMFSWR